MSSMIGGGITTGCHLFVQYPFTMACLVTLGLGSTAVLTAEQKAECDKIVEACQAPAPLPPPVAILPPAAPPATVVEVPPAKVVIDPCVDAPEFTKDKLFVSTGKPFMWKNPGLDPVSGKAPQPYLAQLQFTPEEQAIFLEKIAKKDGEMATFEKGDVLGLMTSGSGKLRTNATVDFTPVAQTGSDYTKDNRMRVYTHKQLIRLNGECVYRQMVLLEPFVCGNWTRMPDLISPWTRVSDAVTPAPKEAK